MIKVDMADEDEIDVLGDYNLDSLISKNENNISSSYDNSLLPNSSELLECDYGLNSTWLIDHGVTPAGDIWYANSATDFSSEDSPAHTSLGFDEVICSENKNCDDTDWTEEEKSLLERGLEIFGRSSVRLSQIITSKSPSQIKYYLNNKYTESNIAHTISLSSIDNENIKSHVELNESDIPPGYSMDDIIEDAQIPASIEEVIAVVSTAKPTIQEIKKNQNKRPLKKFVKKSIRQSILKNMVFHSQKRRKENNITIPAVPKRIYKNNNENVKQNKIIKPQEIPQRKQIIPVSSGEEVIKISKENSDSDVDEDIEIDIDETEDNKEPKPNEQTIDKIRDNINDEVSKEIVITSEPKANEIDNDNMSDLIKNIDENVLNFLKNEGIPTKEYILDEDEITDVEKFIHSEFFEGKSVKTPGRYLKIRNFIIEYWLLNKPAYCTKTSVRNGLKNCGDVNCIGRIHQFLEQIGAINFGCLQVQYIRPLLKIVFSNHANIQAKIKSKKDQIIPVIQQRSDVVRARMKKKYNNDGEGGYTMIHDENGDIIDTTVINQDKKIKARTYRKGIKLVYCKNFTQEYQAPYSIDLHLDALLMIDLHAHTALIEVMGLLGGFYDTMTKTLHINRYVPCKNVDHSNTHCDMCPVSQSQASEIIQNDGLEVIGWFHSHPTFYPNPSLQDIDTQLSMQEYLSSEVSPFVGVILSPFRSFTNTLVSEYRCLIVEKSTNQEESGTPYKFSVNINSDGFNVESLLDHVKSLLLTESNIPNEYIVDFQKPYFYDNTITYLEKFLSSVKIHLARCSNINKMTCDAIIDGLQSICTEKVS